MKARRFLSLVLALAMTLSLLPTFSLTAGAAELNELNYMFTKGAFVDTSFTDGTDITKISDKTLNPEETDSWTVFTRLNINWPIYPTGAMSYLGNASLGDGNNSIVIKINVDKAGKYTPTLKYHTWANGGAVDAYIIDPAYSEKATSYNTSAGILAFIAAADVADSGVVRVLTADTWSATASDQSTPLSASGNPITLEAKEYYLVFTYKQGAQPSTHAKARTYNYIHSFNLKEVGAVTMQISADKTSLKVGGEANVSAKLFEGESEISGDIFYSSSKTDVATVDASGKVSAKAEGTARITASATVGGKEVSAYVDINVMPLVDNPKYVFEFAAIKDAEGKTVDLATVTSYDMIDTSVSSGLWHYVGREGGIYSSLALNQGFMQFSATAAGKELGQNAMRLAITVDKSGMYIPTLTHVPHQISTSYIDVFLISKADYDAEKKSGLTLLSEVLSGQPSKLHHIIKNVYNYNADATAQSVDGAPIELSAGEYYLYFTIDAAENGTTGNKNGRYFIQPQSLELRSFVPFVELAEEKVELEVGSEFELRGKLVAGTSDSGIALSYESSAPSVATVDASGKVIAKSVGTATITASATYKGTEYKKTAEIIVSAYDPGNGGVSKTYLFGTQVMTDAARKAATEEENDGDSDRGLTSGGVLYGTSFMDEYSEVDESKTALWVWSALGSKSFTMTINTMDYSSKRSNLGGSNSDSFPVMQIEVPNKGDYNLYMDVVRRSYGMGADIYFVNAKDVTTINRAYINTLKGTSAGRVDSDGMGDSGLIKVGEYNFPKAGTYYMILDLNSENTETLANGKQTLAIKSMKLSAKPKEFAKVDISLYGIDEGDPIALKSVRDINVKITDDYGIEIDEFEKGKEPEIKITSSDESVAVITEDGRLDASGCGTAEIIATVKYGGKEISGKLDILVTPVGKNVIADERYNGNFENDNWIWTVDRVDEAPETPWWGRFAILNSPTEENENNRALAYVINPECSVADAGYAKYPPSSLVKSGVGGYRFKVKSGQLYMLSFKIKLENWKTPDGAAKLGLGIGTYSYGSESSTSVISGLGRTIDISLDDDYVKKYSEWQQVYIPIIAPFESDIYDDIYITPQIAIRPTSANLNRKGYEGTVWMDDFELREVGFADVELQIDGNTDAGTTNDITIIALPRTATGDYISFAEDVLETLKFENEDELVIGNIRSFDYVEIGSAFDRYSAQTTGKLGGKNGKSKMRAEMTIHGVTRSGEYNLDVSGFALGLLYFEATAEPVETGEGNTTQIVAKAYLTDGNEADITNASIIYRNKSKDIISVDENGVVTPLAAGTAKVDVIMTLDGVIKTAEATIIVRDTSKLVSAELSGPETVGYLRDAKLTLSGMTENGYAADMSVADVEWIINASEAGAVSVDKDGTVFGNIKGATAEISAKVTLNGGEITTNVITITVAKSDLRDFTVDFAAAKSEKPKEITIEEDGWEIDFENSKIGKMFSPNRQALYAYATAPEQYVTIRFEVPYSGIYSPRFVGYAQGVKTANNVDVYIDGVFASNYSFYNNGGSSICPEKTFRAIYLDAGIHELRFVTRQNSEPCTTYTMGYVLCRFVALESFPEIKDIRTKKSSFILAEGATDNLGAELITTDGVAYAWQKMLDGSNDPMASVSYASDNGDIAAVSEDGTITAIKEGEAGTTITAIYNAGEPFEKKVAITVDNSAIETKDETLASVAIEATSLVMSTNSDGVELTAVGKNAAGEFVSIEGATIAWESSDTTVAEISENGKVTPVSEGVSEITLTVTAEDASFNATVTVSVRSGKVRRSYYRDDRVEAARENISKYAWAKSISNTAERNAERFSSFTMEDAWKFIPGEGIPRVIQIGLDGDPDRYKCRYCGHDVYSEYSGYPWKTNPIAKPWKIQCQNCKRYFPSNDFAKFYELGIDDRGIFDINIAKEKNAALVEETDGKKDYLRNDLYPEIGSANHPSTVRLSASEDPTRWAVDDSLGYDTGRKYSNGVRELYNYIAYYVHFGLWYSSSGEIMNMVNAMRDAYVYTGDPKYGRIGAIMVDRIADLYPDYFIEKYSKQGYYCGATDQGKLTNNIWDAGIAQDLSFAYDAFFPIYDDPQVINFLKEKKAQYPEIPNEKNTAEDIRDNIEERLLWEIYEGANSLDINGNFGMHQAAMAAAAIVYDTEPRTKTMIDWIFHEAETDVYTYNHGGGVNQQLVNKVSRDGQGTESAPGYNRIWIRDLADVANFLAEYDRYDGVDVWENPKYVTMFLSYPPFTMIRRGLPPIGDSGGMGIYNALPDTPEIIMNAYKYTKKNHPESSIPIAQHLYQLQMKNQKDISHIHYDIFTKNPESIKTEVLDVIKKYGEYAYDSSSILTGYGLAALRDGTLYDTVGTDSIRDTTRDIWFYFGGATSHSHHDKLSFGMDAYGISMTSDNGYPEATGYHPNRNQWTNTTLAHNTVVVDEINQMQPTEPLKPLHFDSNDTRVKVIDVDGTSVYTATDEYRRSMVMIDYNDEVSYTVDFFRVRGGSDHLYAIHASSDEVSSWSEELDLFFQPGGSYAGADVPFGDDPYTDGTTAYNKLKYPLGYTWIENVRRAENTAMKQFYVDYKIKDVRNFMRNPKNIMDIHFRLTMVNDFEPDEVTLGSAPPPRTSGNLQYIKEYEHMLVRRKGTNLNTLFTTVMEPYNKERYIENISAVEITVKEGTPKKTDKAAAIKVELVDGRCDYVVYAQNGDVTYTVTDGDMSFDFKGFIGVWTINENGDNIYSYANDAEILGDKTDMTAKLTGTVTGFTRELALDNYIDIALDQKVEDASIFNGRMINVEFKGAGNAAYWIHGAELSEDGMSAKLDIKNVTLIDSYIDDGNTDAGYNYDIAEGKHFEIALANEDNHAPIFDAVSESISTSAGSSVSVTVNAKAQLEGEEVTYSARTLPRGASFNAETATISWKPTGSQIGKNLVAIDATDTSGRTSTIYFTVTVYGSTTGGSGGGAGGGGGSSAPAPSNPTIPTTPGADKPGTTTPSTPSTPSEPSTPATPETDKNVRFVDLGAHDWAADAINALADEGIIKGTSENTFSPAANITRADFAILLVRAFKLASENTESFADVADSDYFAKELAVARNTGLVNGIGENKFAPRNNITRQDMMVIVYRALVAMEKEFDTTAISASDFDKVAGYARDAVAALVNAKLISGKNGLIDPTAYTTRAEVAVLIQRILDFIK